MKYRLSCALGIVLGWFAPAALLAAPGGFPGSDAGLPLKAARTIEFTVHEGTNMSLDIIPAEQALVFDLLGHLYRLSVDGGQAHQLTQGIAWDRQPRVSPDGRHVVFISDRSGTENLWIMNSDGTELRQLTHETVDQLDQPHWSADGRTIVVGQVRELWRYDVRSGVGALLYAGTGSGPLREELAARGAFLPHGDSLAVTVSHSGGWPDRIASLDLATQRLSQILVSKAGVDSPLVSPDGKWLAYVSNNAITDSLSNTSSGDGTVTLWLHDLGGEDKKPVIEVPLLAMRGFLSSPIIGGEGFPGYVFTPDSHAIILATPDGKLMRVDVTGRTATAIPFKVDVKAELGPLAARKIKLDGGPLQVSGMQGVNQSADGKRLTFSAVGKVWISNLRGTPQRLTASLMDGRTREYDPVFSPDGHSVVFASWSDTEGGQLWRVPSSGGSSVRLTTNFTPADARAYASPRFTPDGIRVVFFYSSVVGWLRGDCGLEKCGFTQQIGWLQASGGPIHSVAAQSVEGFTDSEEFFYLTAGRGDISISRDREGRRIYFHANGTDYVRSIGLEDTDGKDIQTHAHFLGIAKAKRIAVSPDARWLAIESNGNICLAPLSRTGAAVPAFTLPGVGFTPDKNIIRVTLDGGQNPAWSADGKWLTWSRGNTFLRAPLQRILDKNRDLAPQVIPINLSVPRAIPDRAVVLRGARVLRFPALANGPSSAGAQPSGGDLMTIEQGDVVIKGRRIVAVGPSGSVVVPSGAKVIDIKGKIVIPGLIDMHNMPTRWSPVIPDLVAREAEALAYGVTTIRTLDFEAKIDRAHAELLETGQLLGPRAFGSLGILHAGIDDIVSLQDAIDKVRKRVALGATLLKGRLYPHRIEWQWLIQAAAQEGGIDAVFCQGPALHKELSLVLDGYSGKLHAFNQYPINRDVVELLARSGITLSPHRGLAPLVLSLRTKSLQQQALFPLLPKADEDFKEADLLEQRVFLDVLRAGGNVAIGSHMGTYGSEQISSNPGEALISAMLAQAAGGMTPEEVLRAATVNGARGLGLEADLGSIEAGKIADLVVLRENPLDDLRNVTQIQYVIKDGVVYDGPTLDEVWPVTRKFQRQPWQTKMRPT